MFYKVVLIFWSIFNAVSCYANEDTCSGIQLALQVDRHNASLSRFAGFPEKVCSGSCCTKDIEVKLSVQNTAKLLNDIQRSNAKLNEAFTKLHKMFDGYFMNSIDLASSSLDSVFTTAYGTLYSNNSHLFKTMFDGFKQYYREPTYDVREMLDGFFTSLMQKGFQLLHEEQIFSDDYMQCIAYNMDNIRPFAHIPYKMTFQIEQTFARTRAFVRGLNIGRTIGVDEFSPSLQCKIALMKMTSCPVCEGLPPIRACHGLCMNVIGGCLTDHHHLQQTWKKYIEAMLRLIDRLRVGYNMEDLLRSHYLHVSEAITLLQDNSIEISEKVYRNCGKGEMKNRKEMKTPADHRNLASAVDGLPKHARPNNRELEALIGKVGGGDGREQGMGGGRYREQADVEELDDTRRRDIEDMKSDDGFDLLPSNKLPKSPFTSLVIKAKILLGEYERHWVSLPRIVCKEAEDSDLCWNGVEKGRYMLHVAGNPTNNPELNTSSHVIGFSTRNHVINLTSLIGQLDAVPKERFYNTNDDEDLDGSGSADGSGDSRRAKELTSTPSTMKCPGCGGSSLKFSSITIIPLFLLSLLNAA